SREDVDQPGALIVMMTFFIVVVVVLGLTLSGTLIFVMIGKNEQRADELPECLEKARHQAYEIVKRSNDSRTNEDVRHLILDTLKFAKRCDEE
ncbi:hypothetical protein PMAYCL1PPCAC_13408, partial [Pristionchus mayeri]